MRLWHKSLISFLPQKQLTSQWRELCCIAKNIATNGTPNHILVNKVLDYPTIHFVLYVDMILNEMHKRGYKISESSYIKLKENIEAGSKYFSIDKNQYVPAFDKDIYSGWMNDKYLRQCFYNLQEKYDCGGIKQEEYDRLVEGILKIMNDLEVENG